MQWITSLESCVPKERISANETLKEQHSKDESYHEPYPPDVVVFPETAKEISRVVSFANEYKIPIVPFGISSSLEGHTIPLEGGISIDFQLMNKVVDIQPDDFLVKVQPGITRTQLNQELKKYGLFFPVDPGADATIGGMTANNASGTMSVRYGIMRDQVRDLEVVMANGDVIHTGGQAEKSSSGYNLNNLFIGSEGTLGVFTEITLHVHGIPETIMGGRAVFSSVEYAVNAALGMLSAGIPIARVELMDTRSMQQANVHSETDYLEKPTLFLEFHGNEAGLKQDIEFTKEIMEDQGVLSFNMESNSKERARLWEARHNLAYAFIHGYPDKKMMITDVCLPLSELTNAIINARRTINNSNIDGGILGHIGDGNFHCFLMFDPEQQLGQVNEVNEIIVEYALTRNGTCTGEHGVGIGKKKYQVREHGKAQETMLLIKQSLDKRGILNPGKIF